MENPAQIIIASTLLAGLAMDLLAKQIRIPRVSLLLVLGILVGPSAFNLVPDHVIKLWFPPLTNIALSMIAFLLGSKLTLKSLKKIGKYVFSILIGVVLITSICVFIGLLVVHTPLQVALLLAGLSTATAPAATFDVVMESKVKSRFSLLLLDIVAIDDAWCLIIFSLMMALVHFSQGHYSHISQLLLYLFREIGGAILVGIVLGIPAAYLSGRIKPGEATLTEALGIVLFGCGAALLLHVSLILTLIVLGMSVSGMAKHHKRAFHAIEGIEWPFLVLFFILAGTTFNIKMLAAAGTIGVTYIVFRVIGRVVGAWLGGTIVNADSMIKRWMGVALLPQAGLSIGLGLVATQTFPVVLGSTIIFEIFGPVLTRKALAKTH